MLKIGLIALGVSDIGRAAELWCQALGYELREDGFAGGRGCWCLPAVPASSTSATSAAE